MKKILHIASIQLVLLLGFSCSSSFLELNPTDSSLANKAITNVKEAKVAMNGVYYCLSNTEYYGRDFLLYADFKGPDMLVPMGGRGNDGLYTFNHSAESNAFGGYWDIMYFTLTQINNVLNSIDAGKVTALPSEQATLDDIKGQALALRALVHFDLVRLYGYPYRKNAGETWGAAIVTTTLNSNEKMQRSTVAQTYEQVEKDLELAAGASPLLSKAKTKGRISYWGAKTLIAKVALYKGDWEKAYNAAKEVIEQGGYTPYAPKDWVASWSNNFGSESIFELVVKEKENDLGSSSPCIWLSPLHANNGRGALIASDRFLDLLKEDLDDVRWGIMALDEYGYAPKGKEPKIPDRKGWVKKYNRENEQGKLITTAVNIIVSRISEVYLIAAEAAVRKSNPDKNNAVKWLNEIRKRAKNLPLAQENDDLVTLILQERSKELICEGHSYFDHMRLGLTIKYEEAKDIVIPSGGRPLEINWDFKKCILPISRVEKLANKNIQQNDGY